MYDPELKEFCGVTAIYSPTEDAAALTHRALFALQHRGQESAGIVTVDAADRLHHLRARGLVTDALPLPQVCALPGQRAIGHVRYSTIAADRAENVQPFFAATPYGELAIAHNGNIKNADILARELREAGSILGTTMDTELLVHLVARSQAADLAGALQCVAQKALGAYSLTMLCAGRLYGLRDAYGLRPLVLGQLAAGGWVLASETCALDTIDARFIREVRPGELIEIGPHGVQSQQLLPPAPVPAPCIFELVYFARPDSLVFGQNAQAARTRMGEQLAQQDHERDGRFPAVDMVVPVPDSGIPAAIGYSRISNIPYECAILRSHYFGRTFLLPTHDARAEGVRLKLTVNRELVTGKRVLLVDDSLVRGNTARELVRLVREAGAAQVWMRIASPPLRWPCYLGIDMPSRQELIINAHGDEAGVQAHIGVDDLRYLSESRLRQATAQAPSCMACMNGRYPL